MGKLVFQATLGGQVNLVGPNTASTYDINVPAVAGNMVTTGDTGTVTNTMCATSVYTAPGTIGSGTPNSGAFTSLSYSTTLTGGTGVVNLGSGQFYKDSSGNVGIGTSSPTYKLQIKGDNSAAGGLLLQGTAGSYGLQIYHNGPADTSYIYNYYSGPMLFGTNNTERMRLDSSGNLLVGTTSVTSGRLNVNQSASGFYSGRFDHSNASSPYGLDIYYSATAPNNTSSGFVVCEDNVGVKAVIRSNGGIANYSANNVNLSDSREKTNANPAGDYLAKICAIPVRTYNYIDQNLEEDDGLTLGVFAQDVQAVAPELVAESNWGTAEEPKTRLSIYQTDLQYALMKCIQEQQALITQLQADVAALKAA